MGEHWFQSDLLRESVCDLERPAFLQYLMIEGAAHADRGRLRVRRDAADARWFGPEAVWHRHGPELCRFRSGVFNDASYLRQGAPESAQRRHLGGHLRALVGGARATRDRDAAHLELDRAPRRSPSCTRTARFRSCARGCACRAGPSSTRRRVARRSTRCGSPTATRPGATRAPSSSRISAASTAWRARRVLRRGAAARRGRRSSGCERPRSSPIP